jgi:hypothetical protein
MNYIQSQLIDKKITKKKGRQLRKLSGKKESAMKVKVSCFSSLPYSRQVL